MHPLLVVDPDPAARAHAEAAVTPQMGFRVHTAPSLPEARAVLARTAASCILTDLTVPPREATVIVAGLRAAAPGTPVIVWTERGDDRDAAAAMRTGAVDYLRKSDGPTALAIAVQRAVGAAVWRAADTIAHGPLADCADTEPILATTAVMRHALALVDRAAESAVPVLLLGETGTGKEVLARAIHERGPRRRSGFVTQNCAAIPETLLESELFGHRRGAFTGAERDRPGLFVEAGDGTVFLDEIGEAPPAVQAKLLRVLQHGEVKAVGADRPTRVQARIVAATNRALDTEIAERRFRSDLYFRLAVFPIAVPPLRHRAADVPPLAERFRRRAEAQERRRTGGFAPATLRALAAYTWPGNVRELEHEVHRLVLTVALGQRIQPEHLALRIRAETAIPDEPLGRLLERVELAIVRERLDRYASKAATARSLGITREALYAKLRRLGLSP